MPPITSSRAGTRVTQTSPELKNPARPVRSLLGLRSSCSNSRASKGNDAFSMDGGDDRPLLYSTVQRAHSARPTHGPAGGERTRVIAEAGRRVQPDGASRAGGV